MQQQLFIGASTRHAILERPLLSLSTQDALKALRRHAMKPYISYGELYHGPAVMSILLRRIAQR